MPGVNAELIVTQESGTGKRVPLAEGELTLGRNPDSGLQFDPMNDLTVSGSHAAVSMTGQGWTIRDLGSLNGTFVNGEKISAPVVLRDQDRIQLGADGPLIEFRLVPPSEAARVPEVRKRRRGKRRARSRHLWTTVVALTLILAAVTLLALHSWREGRLYLAQIQVMQERVDSILDASAAAAAALEGRIQGLHAAITESREALQTVRSDLEAAQRTGNSEEIANLRIQLQEAQAAVVRYQLAAELDYEAIETAKRPAVAKVFVDFGDEVVTASAFAVRPDGTFLTSRHVVAGPSGNRTPRRVAIQFADSRQVWPARTLAISPSDDLAILKVDNIIGDVPVIGQLNRRPDTIQPGQGVAIIGFPLGGPASAGEGQQSIARATLTAGIVRAVTADLLEVNGYGVEGSSGSPLIDENGEVIGVLFGGRVEDGERTLFAVPANRAFAFLNRLP